MRVPSFIAVSAAVLLGGHSILAAAEPEAAPQALVPAYFYPAGDGLAEWDQSTEDDDDL